ncbi:MAG: ribosomal protection-like ABC-F family protein [Roseburia sp.]
MQKRQLICAEQIRLQYGEQMVLDFDHFYVYEGEKIGLVGVNGVGKTSLLRILSGEREPDAGKVELRCEPFYFKQFGEGYDAYELDGKEVSALGIRDKIWQETVSGGEETRIRLAELFGKSKAVAFLDEPTANLDQKGIALLTRRLRELDTFVLVSHDRGLLNALCTRIVELSFGKLQSFDGNYDSYRTQKEEQVKREWTEYEDYTAEKKRLERVYHAKKDKAKAIERRPHNMSPSEAKTLNFIATRKIEDKARSMENSAKNVLKRIEHMDKKEKPKEIPRIRPDFRLTNPPENRIVIRGEHVSFRYDEQTVILEDASFQIENRSRVAILGENGVGKTTLLHLIRDRKQISVVPGAKIGFLEQNLSQLCGERTVLENVMAVSIQREEVARIILSRLLLSERDMGKLVSELSGGERMKLAFAMLLVSDANLLILDEPTNYLDIPSLEALEELLREYEGTLVLVSHDMAFVKGVATQVLEVKERGIYPFYGTVEEYYDSHMQA